MISKNMQQTAVAATVTNIASPIEILAISELMHESLHDSKDHIKLITLCAHKTSCSECKDCGGEHEDFVHIGMLSGIVASEKDAVHLAAGYIANHSDDTLAVYVAFSNESDNTVSMLRVTLDKAVINESPSATREQFEEIVNHSSFSAEGCTIVDGNALRELHQADIKIES